MKITRILLICTLIVTSVLIAGCGEEQVAKAGDNVSVHYTLTLADGTEVESSQGGEPLSFELGAGQLISGFDQAVTGMKVGEIKTVTLPPEEAYGYPSDDLLLKFNRDELPEGMENPQVGQLITLALQSGGYVQKPIVEVTDEYIIVDANHELAGETLIFEIELLSIQSGD